VFPLLILSKRMHSIFVLRCFNDCFAVLGLFAALFCYQRDQWHLGSFLFATGLNVKMSLLLPLPALGFLVIQKLGSREAMTQAMIIFQTTVCCITTFNNMLLKVARFCLDIHSGSSHFPTLAERSNSAELSSTSGR
jgi:Gpi18-like mannosyltransferase